MASSNSNDYPSFGPSNSRNTSETPPKCFCKLPCVVRTVKKETANKGRRFWGCRDFVSKEDPFGCAFMKWTSDPWPPQTQRQYAETQLADTRAEPHRAEIECAHCVDKKLEIAELRNTIKEMKKDGESTKNLLKIALYSIFLLVVACVMQILKSGYSV